jgi:hypothetical protein
MKRIDKWREPYYLPRIISGDTDPELEKLLKTREIKENKDELASTGGFSLTTMILASKEIIFDLQNEEMKLIFVMYALDQESLQICVTNLLETADPLSGDDVKRTLAAAHVYEIPVLPNSDDCQDKLLQLYSDL